MTAIKKASGFSKGTLPVIAGDCAGDVVVNDYYVDVLAAQLTAGGMFDVGQLPAGHIPVGVTLAPDDLDTDGTPAITLDVGILTGTPGDETSDRTCGAEFLSASTVGQGGTEASATVHAMRLVTPVDYHRSIGVKVVTPPDAAAAGRIRLRVLIAPAGYSQQF